ncbi:MAG: hypothetical protein ACE5Z5_09270 [Candidatus Bathyarchaeia archaeon]
MKEEMEKKKEEIDEYRRWWEYFAYCYERWPAIMNPARVVAGYRTVCTVTRGYAITFSLVPTHGVEGLDLGLPPGSVDIRREWLIERRKRADEFRERRLKGLRERRRLYEESRDIMFSPSEEEQDM